MKRISRAVLGGLLGLGLGACAPAGPSLSPNPSLTPTPTPTSAPTPAPVSQQSGEDVGPPMPLLTYRPQGDPRAGLEKSARLPGYDETSQLPDNPVPWLSTSVGEGQQLYRENCASCHCWDGDGDGPASAACQPEPRNFKRLQDYKYGTGDVALFRTARYGIPGTSMAPSTLTDEQLWKIVHFLRMLQPDPRASEALIDAAPSMSTAVRGGLYDGEMTEHDTFAWTDGPTTRFAFRLEPRKGPYRLVIRAKAAHPKVDVTVTLNGHKLGSVQWTQAAFFDFRSLSVPANALRSGENKLTFQYQQVGPLSSADSRQTSLCLDYVTLLPQAP